MSQGIIPVNVLTTAGWLLCFAFKKHDLHKMAGACCFHRYRTSNRLIAKMMFGSRQCTLWAILTWELSTSHTSNVQALPVLLSVQSVQANGVEHVQDAEEAWLSGAHETRAQHLLLIRQGRKSLVLAAPAHNKTVC